MDIHIHNHVIRGNRRKSKVGRVGQVHSLPLRECSKVPLAKVESKREEILKSNKAIVKESIPTEKNGIVTNGIVIKERLLPREMTKAQRPPHELWLEVDRLMLENNELKLKHIKLERELNTTREEKRQMNKMEKEAIRNIVSLNLVEKQLKDKLGQEHEYVQENDQEHGQSGKDAIEQVKQHQEETAVEIDMNVNLNEFLSNTIKQESKEKVKKKVRFLQPFSSSDDDTDGTDEK